MYQIISGYKTYIFRKKFLKKERKTILKNINLSVTKGKVTGLIGLNGAGKSTIIKIFTGLTNLSEGQLVIDGKEIKNKKRFMHKINLVIGGERNLYWRLTGYQNLEYFGNLYGINNLSQKISDLLFLVGLSDVANTPVEHYSKGMKQRLQIAKGLINDPEYLFLDEPTLGIDQQMTKDLQNLIRNISKEKDVGILITSHLISDIESTSDYIYILDAGKIIEEGTIKYVLEKNQIQHLYKIIFKEKIASEVLRLLKNFYIPVTSKFIQENAIEIYSITDIEHQLHDLLSKNHFTIYNFSHSYPKLETLIERRLEK